MFQTTGAAKLLTWANWAPGTKKTAQLKGKQKQKEQKWATTTLSVIIDAN